MKNVSRRPKGLKKHAQGQKIMKGIEVYISIIRVHDFVQMNNISLYMQFHLLPPGAGCELQENTAPLVHYY